MTKERLLPFATNNALLHLELLDLSDKNSVISFAKAVSQIESKIDVLVHNGAALFNDLTQSNYPRVEMTLATNHLGAFLLTHELDDFLQDFQTLQSVVHVSSCQNSSKVNHCGCV